jgi:hypothetical protein
VGVQELSDKRLVSMKEMEVNPFPIVKVIHLEMLKKTSYHLEAGTISPLGLYLLVFIECHLSY